MGQPTIAAKIEELETNYRMPEGGRTNEFLAARPQLVDIPFEAYPHIQKHFDPGASVELAFHVITKEIMRGKSWQLFNPILMRTLHRIGSTDSGMNAGATHRDAAILGLFTRLL